MAYAIAVSRFCETYSRTYQGRHVASQLFRSATAVAANYRAVCRAKSKPDFIAKLGTVIEEADESDFWLEFSVATLLVKAGSEQELRREASELVAIFSQSQMTAKKNLR